MSAENKLAALDIGDEIWGMFKRSAHATADGVKWIGGALQGEFNTKATVGQIVVDAVISMFPITGEITAARDATAITLRMSESDEAANNKWEWVSLVLCLLALVPLVGGVLKGVGRLTIRAASKAEKLAKLAEDILSFLRKMGYGDVTKFLKNLDFAKYQSVVLTGFREVVGRISKACTFIVKKMDAVLPKGMKDSLSAMPQRLERLNKTADRMIPEAFKELNAQLKKIQEALHDGSYITPIHVGPKKSQVMVQEGRLVSQKVIVGHIEHPPATLSQYRKQDGWPDLEAAGRSKLETRKENKAATDTGHLWPINTFSAKAPMKAHTAQPGEVLYRVLDKTVPEGKTAPKYTLDFHKAGDCWTPQLLKNGHEFRTKAAVMHGWNANGYIEALTIPSRAQLEKLGITVPDHWQGLRTWRGGVGGQLDNQMADNGLRATHTWLEGGGVQDFIDWSHPHNAPVRDYLLRTVQVKPTGWTDLQLPVNPNINTPNVVKLADLERSAKIQQQGYVLRGAATVGKQSNNESQQDR